MGERVGDINGGGDKEARSFLILVHHAVVAEGNGEIGER